ncbi:MAG: NAD-dependent epimerase/dehydratase family protein [Proteobacteria bacterium]|nr:NAD-dependent epimerase/dehydratase family protein [Pseudomonadota bacterium]
MPKALVFGATGVIGSRLLELLLTDSHYDLVIAVTRRGLKNVHPKLVNLIGDFHSLEPIKDKLVADDVFIALGTTKGRTPDPKEYYQIDHDYPVLAAKIARSNGAMAVHFVSAIGADAKSSMFYVKTKGEVERDVLELGYPRTNIFQPSMLLGPRAEKRPAEQFFKNVWPVIDALLVGPLSRYRGIASDDVAKAMVQGAKESKDSVKVWQWSDMRSLLDGS